MVVLRRSVVLPLILPSVLLLLLLLTTFSEPQANQATSLTDCPLKCPFKSSETTNDEKNHGGWDPKLWSKQHVGFDGGFAKTLVQYIISNTPGKGAKAAVSVGDIGAGVGQFGAWLRDNQVTNVTWKGWDGGPDIESFYGKTIQLRDVKEYLVPLVCYMDASSDVGPYLSQICGAPYDWVVSIEVGEHIPAERMSTFLDNLVMLAKVGIVLTWAIPGQGGLRHVNELSNDAIVQEMSKRGMKYQEDISLTLRKSAHKNGWLRKTSMVFIN